jgi:NhaP-type Na+/H+ or K+/H+ antiporter
MRVLVAVSRLLFSCVLGLLVGVAVRDALIRTYDWIWTAGDLEDRGTQLAFTLLPVLADVLPGVVAGAVIVVNEWLLAAGRHAQAAQKRGIGSASPRANRAH